MRPKVVPLSGSTAISGTGMKGAVDGLNHCDNPGGGNCGAAPPASGAGWSSALQSAHASIEEPKNFHYLYLSWSEMEASNLIILSKKSPSHGIKQEILNMLYLSSF